MHDIEGIFTLLPTSEGGRQRHVLSGYRPIHAVRRDYLTSGLHEYVGTDRVDPGQSARVRVKFVSPQHYPHTMWVGRAIRVQEGERLIGNLLVERVNNPILLVESGDS